MIRRRWDAQQRAARVDNTVFQCSNIKCAYAIDSVALNKVQLQVLRRTAKRCPECGTLAKFLEQTSLPNIQTKQQSLMEGQNNEDLTQKTNSAIPKTQSQRRRAARYTGA